MRTFLTAVFLVAGFAVLHAQRAPDNVMIYSGETDAYQPCEPSIAISPSNPDILVAGSVLDNVHRSTDGGWTWKTETLTSRFGVFGDPCVVASPKGDFYYLHLSNPDGLAWSSEALLDRIVDSTGEGQREAMDQGGWYGIERPERSRQGMGSGECKRPLSGVVLDTI